MPALTLYADSRWTSPSVFHAMIALEEKLLPYKLEVLSSPLQAVHEAELVARALTATPPILVHDDVWIAEGLPISEYLAERFPAPAHPRLFPPDLGERARARQVMTRLRTGLAALREERPSSSVFGRPTARALSERGAEDAAELVRMASALVAPGRTHLFGAWCIADADLSLALMRLVANDDPVPRHLVDYSLAQWDRRSVRKFIAHLPTAP